MTEALTEVVNWALRQPSIWRVGSVADVDNAASVRVMEKTGVECEGLLRRWIIHPNAGDAARLFQLREDAVANAYRHASSLIK